MSTTEVINPATGAVFTTVPSLDVARTDAAIERAAKAFEGWRAVAPGDRARLLRRFAAVVEEHLEELARLEVRNAGHTIGNARWEAGNVRDVLNYYAGAPERLSGRQIPVAGGVDVTFHEPLGVVGIIVPWNFPMPIAGWGFAPALAAGNTVVLKPAELTPLTAIRLGELALDAGLPEGVFQVLPGKGSVVGQRFVTHPAVRKVCFTGSTEVGKSIMAGCADQVKRVTLELGGKSANVIFADADLEKAAAAAPGAVFDNAGQDCCARSRLLVEASVYDKFLALLEPAVRKFRVLDPSDDLSEMGPLISSGQRDTVAGFVTDADVAFRGDAPESDGWWFPPTVLLAGSTTAGPPGRGRGRRAAGLAESAVHPGGRRGRGHRRPAPARGRAVRAGVLTTYPIGVLKCSKAPARGAPGLREELTQIFAPSSTFGFGTRIRRNVRARMTP